MTETRATGWPGEAVRAPGLEMVHEAAERLRGMIVRTPLMASSDDNSILLKPETLQPIGSFKIRGVGNWALSLSEADASKGLSTTSAGNTAQALGYMGRRIGVPTRSYVPSDLHQTKRAAIEAYGTELVDVTMTELMLYMFEERWRDEPYQYLNPWGEPLMIAGHGTIALELHEDLPDIESVFVPVGGGALIAGVAATLKALKPEIRVFGVQAEINPALQSAFDAGGAVWIDWKKTIVEGASTPVITHNMYPMLKRLIDEVVLVSEDEVRASMRRLMFADKLVTEGAGAVALAAAAKTPRSDRGLSVAIVSGASIDNSLLAEIVNTA